MANALTQAAARGGDAHGQGAMPLKVGGHNGKAGHKYHASTNAEANALSEEGLIVLLDQAGHHEAENNKK